MPDNHIGLSIATTISGVVGGLAKAIADHATISSITISGAIDVALYAVISAGVGYGVKRTLDYLLNDDHDSNSKGL